MRKVSTNLIISTVAGNGNPGFSGDGGNPNFAKLSHPNGVAVDSSGNVYIADTLNSRIRLVSPNSATINTVIGTGQAAYFGDNGPGLQAAVNFPAGLSFDSSGNLIIADTDNSVIRKFVPGGSSGSKPAISPGGVVTASQFGGFSTIAPGAWIEIYGSNLANTTTDWSNSFQGINAPTTLGGTTVTVGGLNAYVEYVSPGQVNVQAPFALNPGSQQWWCPPRRGRARIIASMWRIRRRACLRRASFQWAGSNMLARSIGMARWVMPVGAVAGFTSSPAKAGETITLYGVGFGQVNPSADGWTAGAERQQLTYHGADDLLWTVTGDYNLRRPDTALSRLVPVQRDGAQRGK